MDFGDFSLRMLIGGRLVIRHKEKCYKNRKELTPEETQQLIDWLIRTT